MYPASSVVKVIDPDTSVDWRHQNEEGHNDTCRRNDIFIFVVGLDIYGKSRRALGYPFDEPVVYGVTD
jgi:hypothetical protein